jgi:hypothetical protein
MTSERRFQVNNEKKAPVLTLEYLAPYLPYEVQGQTDHAQFIITGATTEEVIGDNDLGEQTFDYEDVNLRLRPMSEFDKIDNDFDLTTDFETAYVTNRNDIAFINTSDKTYLSDIKTVVKFLFENKFDVFGLIEKGLAIDINSIEGKETNS